MWRLYGIPGSENMVQIHCYENVAHILCSRKMWRTQYTLLLKNSNYLTADLTAGRRDTGTVHQTSLTALP